MNTTVRFETIASPLGALLVAWRGEALAGLYFEGHRPAPKRDAGWVGGEGRPQLRSQLAEYFSGARRRFELPLALAGTPFQRAVWDELAKIPPGETVTYAELARRVGRPGAARAVGGAVARNPVSIVVPCHRVVGTNGALMGYAGGEERKRWLLAHEQRNEG